MDCAFEATYMMETQSRTSAKAFMPVVDGASETSFQGVTAVAVRVMFFPMVLLRSSWKKAR